MSNDDQTEDSDAQDTRVIPGVDVENHVSEGTLEMDRDTLLQRLQADRGSSDSDSVSDSGETRIEDYDVAPDLDHTSRTLQVPSVDPTTQPSATVELPAAAEPDTKHYQVPAALMERLKDGDNEATTVSFSVDGLAEFRATIDESGRITVPAEMLGGRFKPGSRVIVVMRLDDGETG